MRGSTSSTIPIVNSMYGSRNLPWKCENFHSLANPSACQLSATGVSVANVDC